MLKKVCSWSGITCPSTQLQFQLLKQLTVALNCYSLSLTQSTQLHLISSYFYDSNLTNAIFIFNTIMKSFLSCGGVFGRPEHHPVPVLDFYKWVSIVWTSELMSKGTILKNREKNCLIFPTPTWGLELFQRTSFQYEAYLFLNCSIVIFLLIYRLIFNPSRLPRGYRNKFTVDLYHSGFSDKK